MVIRSTPDGSVRLETDFYVESIPGTAASAAIGATQVSTVDMTTYAADEFTTVEFTPSTTVQVDVDAGEFLVVNMQRAGLNAGDTETGTLDVVGFWVNYSTV